MKISSIVIRASRSLRHAKTRTFLTSLSIAVGAFTIVLSLAAGAGGRMYTNQIVQANTDVLEISVTATQPSAQSAPQRYSPGQLSGGAFNGTLLNQSDIDKINAINGVAEIIPSYNPSVEYIVRDGSDDKYVVKNISVYNSGLALEYSAGSIDGVLGEDEIIITEEYSKSLGFSDYNESVGRTVNIAAVSAASIDPSLKVFPFRVKAVSSESGLAFRAQSSLLMSKNAAKTIYDYTTSGTRLYNNFFVILVLVDDVKKVAEVKQSINDMGYVGRSSEDILGVVNTFINVLQAILLGFGALAILTSVFGIINTQYISVLERTQQIGLMKALGMHRRDVGRLFKLEAAWLGFIGGVLGSALAVVVGLFANPIISQSLDLDDIYLLIFQPLDIAAVVVGLVLVAVAAGILPARKASKLNPIEALRTE
jgi:putative ABC transport system permease protein